MRKYFLLGMILFFLVFFQNYFTAIAQGNDKIKSFNQSIKYEANSDYKNALDVLLKNSNGNNPYLLNMRLGWLNYKNEEYKDSKKYYSAALSQNKSSIETMLGLTLPLSSLGEWNEVVNVYESILKIDSNNYYANLRMGQIYLNKGEYSNAKKYLEKVFALYPGEYEANLSLGWTYFYLGDKQKAKQLFITALMISENDESATEGLKQLE